VAACAAIGLGIWAASLSSTLDKRNDALAREQRVAAILAQPDARTITFSRGTLVVGPSGDAALIVSKLKPPGPGRTYEAWISDVGAPQPAGLFKGGNVVIVPLERPFHAGASVLVTNEQAGGVDAPTQAPFLSVKDTRQS
jgi:hypothetical protein